MIGNFHLAVVSPSTEPVVIPDQLWRIRADGDGHEAPRGVQVAGKLGGLVLELQTWLITL